MTILNSLANITLIITPLILIFLLLMPLLDRKYASGGRYMLWIPIMAVLCLPFVPFIQHPVLQIDVPVPKAISYRLLSVNVLNDGVFMEPSQNNTYTGAENYESIVPAAAQERMFDLSAVDFHKVILFIWLTGIFLSFAYHAVSYLSFRRFIVRLSVPENDTSVIKAFADECSRMKIRGAISRIRLERCKGIKTPILFGFIKPVLLMPESHYYTDELLLIFRHELTHYKRLDLWYKLALVVMKSVYWFNPAIHLMAKQANKDIETVCDTLTVSGMNIDMRKRYSEIILGMASSARVCRTLLTTHFLGDKNMLRQRFSNILGAAKKSGSALFAAMGAVIIASVFLVGFNFAQTPPETYAKTSTALAVLPDVGISVAPAQTSDVPATAQQSVRVVSPPPLNAKAKSTIVAQAQTSDASTTAQQTVMVASPLQLTAKAKSTIDTEWSDLHITEKITIDLINVSLVDFFRMMAEIGNVNIVLDPDISGNITLRVYNIPFEQLFDFVLRNNDLDKNIEGNLIRVFHKAT